MNLHQISTVFLFFIAVDSILSTDVNVAKRITSEPYPDELADLPYGDIKGVSEITEYWPNGLVYYYFQSDSVENNIKNLIWSAMEEFHVNTCIRFEETQFAPFSIAITIEDKVRGCHSQLGRNIKSYISLGYDCLRKGVIIHQLMHALGFNHENNRADRDNYIEIHKSNAKPENNRAFEKFKTFDRNPYDYNSIMHGSRFAFANNPKINTITPRLRSTNIGQRKKLSTMDINRIRFRYQCKDPYSPIMPDLFTTTQTSKPIVNLCKDVPSDKHVLFPHETDCKKFYICSNHEAKELICAPPLVFYAEKNGCSWKGAIRC